MMEYKSLKEKIAELHKCNLVLEAKKRTLGLEMKSKKDINADLLSKLNQSKDEIEAMCNKFVDLRSNLISEYEGIWKSVK